MIEAKSHLIALPGRRVRVLRLMVDGAAFWPLAYTVASSQNYCRICGCTDRYGCAAPHCYWANAARDLCSRCAERITR